MYEKGTLIKDWRNIDLTIALIYPSFYELGISSYSIRLLYYMINLNDKYACERIYLPKEIKFPASKDLHSVDIVRSIENKILPIDFDILGFSVHYENDFKNILWLLEKSNIPLKFEERVSEERKYPIIIGGGPAITSNPLPLSLFFDAFFIGDAEPNIFRFFGQYLQYKNKFLNYSQLMDKLSKIEGIYIPRLKNQVNRIYLENLDDSPTPISQLSLNPSISKIKKIFEENFFIEVNRGCPYQCKFCISSFHNSPFRNRSFESIIQSIEEAIQYNNFKKISLIGSCVSSHPRFLDICNFIIIKKKKISIPSIRLDHITPKLINILERAKIKTITIAPETGAESLRYNLGKKIPNSKIIEVMDLIKQSEIKNVKFYFLVGLPDETDNDISEIPDLLNQISDLGYNKNEMKVNINPFVPKLNTPYQNKCYYYLSENIDKIKQRMIKLEKTLSKIPSIDLKIRNPKNIINNAKLQTIFSLGDEEISELLYHYYINGANFGAMRRTEKELDISIEKYLVKVSKGYVPWKI